MIDLTVRNNIGFMDIEFRINRSETSYHKNHRSSQFLDETIYTLFASCFANSVSHDNVFNYYGQTKFRYDELLKLTEN